MTKLLARGSLWCGVAHLSSIASVWPARAIAALAQFWRIMVAQSWIRVGFSRRIPASEITEEYHFGFRFLRRTGNVARCGQALSGRQLPDHLRAQNDGRRHRP